MISLQLPDAATGSLIATIAWAYLITNAVRVFSYVPQIVTVWRCRDGARSLSLWTWGLWTASHVTAALYGTLVVHDVFFVAISLVNLVGCGAVTMIVSKRRIAARRIAGRSPLGWRNA
jgi:hypothetical protein